MINVKLVHFQRGKNSAWNSAHLMICLRNEVCLKLVHHKISKIIPPRGTCEIEKIHYWMLTKLKLKIKNSNLNDFAAATKLVGPFGVTTQLLWFRSSQRSSRIRKDVAEKTSRWSSEMRRKICKVFFLLVSLSPIKYSGFQSWQATRKIRKSKARSNSQKLKKSYFNFVQLLCRVIQSNKNSSKVRLEVVQKWRTRLCWFLLLL